MKKTFALVIIILIVSGCTGKISENQMIYNGYIEELKETPKITSTKKIVDVNIELERQTADEITYRVTIDNPKVKMNDMEAIVYHNQKTKDVFPSVGIVDDKVNLIPNLKKNKGKDVLGVVLVGYIKTKIDIKDFKPTVKVMILYNNSDNERQKLFYSKTI